MENSLPCRKRPWPRSTLRDELQKRGCAYGRRAWPAMTSRPMPFHKQLKAYGLWARTGNERDHCIAYFWGSLVDGPASRAKRRWRCKTRAPALGSCDGAWQLRAREPPARPSLHMARCMSFQGFCRAALPLAIQLWAGSVLCKSGGWRYWTKLVGRALVA